MEPDKIMGALGALAIGLILATAILGVGVLTLSQVYNQTYSQYGFAVQQIYCYQDNTDGTSAIVGCAGLGANTTPPAIAGNWTWPGALSNASVLDVGYCQNITGAGATDGCEIIQNYTYPIHMDPTNANWIIYLNHTDGASSVSNLNQTATGIVPSRLSETIPNSCLDESSGILTVRIVKNWTTGAIAGTCSNGGTWTSVWTNTGNGTLSANKSLSNDGVNWTVLNETTNYKNAGSAATFQPITYALSASSTFAGWIGTVVITAIAALVIGLVFVIVRIVRGGGSV